MLALIIIIIIVFMLCFKNKETFATSPGTLLQLVSSRAYPSYWARGSYYTPHYRAPSYYGPPLLIPNYRQGTYWDPYYDSYPFDNYTIPMYGFDHIPGSRHSNYYRKYSPLYF